MSDNRQLFVNSVEYDLLTSDSGKAILEKYTLGRRLHEGVQSHVFSLFDIDTGRRFVLKAIPKGDANALDVFLLKNPENGSLPRILDVFHSTRYVYVIREYVDGFTLSEMVGSQGPLPEEAAVQLGISLCDALSWLHHMSPPLVFRDVKPDNIVVAPDGEVKLIDTESIRTHNAAASTDTVYIGTEGYAAPEQYGYAQTDARTDVYGLGATLAFLLTGQKPERVSYGIRRVSSINSACSERISDIVDKCTAFHPDARYQTIDDLQRELVDLLHAGAEARDKVRTATVSMMRDTGDAARKMPRLPRYVAIAIVCVMVMAAIAVAYQSNVAGLRDLFQASQKATGDDEDASALDLTTEGYGNTDVLPTHAPDAVEPNNLTQEPSAPNAQTSEGVALDSEPQTKETEPPSVTIDDFYSNTTIIEAFWSGELPQEATAYVRKVISDNINMFYNPAICFISIDEWDPVRLDKQMNERIEKVGGDFVFVAEGYPDIRAQANGGSVAFHDGSGSFYFLYVENHKDVVAGVEYRMTSPSAHWTVNDDVRIVKPVK